MYVLTMTGIAKSDIKFSMPLAEDLQEARDLAAKGTALIVGDGFEAQPSLEGNRDKWLLWKAAGRIGIVCEITRDDHNPLFDAAEALYQLATAVGR